MFATLVALGGLWFAAPSLAAEPPAATPLVSAAPAPGQIQKQYRLFKGWLFSYSLKLVDAPIPRIGSNEVLVRVHAVSINRRDLYVASGFYPMKKRKSLVPLSDGAGEVVAVGQNVTRFRAGDRVIATYYQSWMEGDYAPPEVAESALGAEIDGMLSQYVKLNEQGLVRLPEHLSYEEGATLPCAGVTAWTALMRRGRMQPGDTVLLEGTGGVSVFGLQFAAAHGAKPIVTSSSAAKLQRAMELGAIGIINYEETEDWEERARELTDGIGVKHVLEVGGEDTLPHAIASLAQGGHLALIGGLTGFGAELPTDKIIAANITVSGISVGSRTDFEAMLAFMEKHQLKPVVDKVFAFQDAQRAYDLMDSGKFFGKIVIQL
jgi:NADPH:quinone reductase-like Zn-dependent oxidoreductase